MAELIILAAALLPAVVLWISIWRKDPQPEPKAWLWKAVIYGAGISVPVVLVESAISTSLFGADTEPTTLLGTTIDAFLVAALPEEGFKLLALWLILRKNPYFDEHFDGIVYAVCVGLGFAAIENVGYLFTYSDEWVSVAVSRALLAVPAHYAFAVIMGYYYSIHHFVDHSSRTAACILLVPVVAHGVYDALALGMQVSALLGSIGTFLLIYFCIKLHRYARARIMEQIARDERQRYL
ncbi:MAG: PrsW family intramembrane metalloprotease [Prevotella sp.]|nr:PrsW family intramembrane metalloprotease [Prevotella sp.]